MKTKNHSGNKIQTNKTLADNLRFANSQTVRKRPFLIYKQAVKTADSESPSNLSILCFYKITMKISQAPGSKFGSGCRFL